MASNENGFFQITAPSNVLIAFVSPEWPPSCCFLEKKSKWNIARPKTTSQRLNEILVIRYDLRRSVIITRNERVVISPRQDESKSGYGWNDEKPEKSELSETLLLFLIRRPAILNSRKQLCQKTNSDPLLSLLRARFLARSVIKRLKRRNTVFDLPFPSPQCATLNAKENKSLVAQLLAFSFYTSNSSM